MGSINFSNDYNLFELFLIISLVDVYPSM